MVEVHSHTIAVTPSRPRRQWVCIHDLAPPSGTGTGSAAGAAYSAIPTPIIPNVTADLYVPAMSGLRLGSVGSTARGSVVRDM